VEALFIVPALVLLFKVDLRYAIGASLVSVIAALSEAAAAYVKEGLSIIEESSTNLAQRARFVVNRP
jgi:hypothetical protein